VATAAPPGVIKVESISGVLAVRSALSDPYLNML
jgi:hypothetical protein